jgi:hypothetical protein
MGVKTKRGQNEKNFMRQYNTQNSGGGKNKTTRGQNKKKNPMGQYNTMVVPQCTNAVLNSNRTAAKAFCL